MIIIAYYEYEYTTHLSVAKYDSARIIQEGRHAT